MKTPASPAIMFDPQRRAATPELRAAIKSLTRFLERCEADLARRQRARADRNPFCLAVEAIACNLAGLVLTGPDRALAVPRRNGVMWSKGRYRSPVYGQHFIDALNLMAHPEVALIEDLSRGYRFPDGHTQASTIKPAAAFFDHHVPRALICWDAFTRLEELEVIVLKGPKDHKTGQAKAIDYPDTATTRRMSRQIRRINAVLQDAPLRLAAEGSFIGFADDGQPVDPTRRTVRRIFNNGSWDEGGRIFDGFWETMRREDRYRFLRICTVANPEGEAVANVDFNQLFPTLAYLRIRHPVPEGDLYDLVGEGISREGWKKLTNALLFADGPIRSWPKETSSLFQSGTKLRDALAMIRHVHAPIAHLFGSRIGFKLMLTESDILLEALAGLSQRGITALPLHDSVLVAGSDAEVAKEVMSAAFRSVIADPGAKAKVGITL